LVTRLTEFTPAMVMMSPALRVPVIALVTRVVPVWPAPLTVPAEKVPVVWTRTDWSSNHL
jgi:hypothetical protein